MEDRQELGSLQMQRYREKRELLLGWGGAVFMMLETETETFLQSYTVSMRPNKDRLLRL